LYKIYPKIGLVFLCITNSNISEMCAVLNSLSCFFDLHNYQKREIEDTFSKLFHAKTNLLIDGMLIGTYSLPITNNDFKLFLRDFYTRPVILKDFSLDINPIQTNVTCKISKPLFSFSNQMLQDVELIKKQLKNINFSYKLSKTHLWFQVMESNIETEFRFYYNDSLDKYSSDGMSYSHFLNRYASVIGSRVPLPEILPGQPPSLAPVALPPPQPSLHQPSLQALSLQTSTSVASAHETPRSHEQFRPVRRLYPDLEDLNLTTSRPSVQGPIARLGTKNHRIIQDVAEEMEVKFDTDMLKKELKKNTSLYYMMLHGVIPLIDKRVQEQDQTEEVTNNILDSENVDENSTRE
jgi:hypothetical protein